MTWIYVMQWLNIVDFFAIAPFYLELAIPSGGGRSVCSARRGSTCSSQIGGALRYFSHGSLPPPPH